MITKVSTTESLKQLFLEIFLNKTEKVSDISDNSILNATAFGVAKVGQKCLKDIAIVESHIFPDSAVGSYLDNAATLYGVDPRKGASGSSTYLRLVADPGTQYLAGTHVFGSFSSVQFELVENVTVGDLGWEYALVRSLGVGSETNVDPNSIITVNPQPVGHIGCTNEYKATGGLDSEDDEMFRMRIKKHLNILSRGTIDYLTEVARKFNSDVLKLINLGINETGVREIAVVLQNGQPLTQNDLDGLLEQMSPYFSLSDINIIGNTVGISLVNVEWEPVDLDFRVQIASNYNTDSVRKDIQVNLTKHLDFRFWKTGGKVEWDDLLQIVKNTEGVKYVPDAFFLPAVDITIPSYKLPRVRGFIMNDLNGNLISDNNAVLLPIFYPIK